MGAFMGVGIVAFVGFAGLSVDAMRGYLVQSRLSSALDAAGLAGARVMFSPTRDADIRMFFESNFPPGYMGATVTYPNSPNPTILEPQVDASNEVLTLTAEATIQTTLMRVLGFDTLTVSATSQITRETEMLDVVIAIDMSGSMNYYVNNNNNAPVGSRRIDFARTAALKLVDILYGTDGLAPLLNIGLVPWSGKVNVMRNGEAFDPTLTTAVTVPSYTNPITGATGQTTVYYANNSPVPLLCRPGAAETFTDTNGNGVRNSGEPYVDCNGNGSYDGAYTWQGCVFARYVPGGVNNDADLEIGPKYAVGGKDWPAWEPIDARGEPTPSGSTTCSLAYTSGSFAYECTSCLSHGITPLQNLKSVIDAAINDLDSPTGSTEMLSGLAWAWRVLVPDAPFTEADPNPQGNRTQAIILLTDGEYTGWSGDAYKHQLGFNTSAQATAYPRLESLATKIKDSGVVIYTIQFANTSSALETRMKNVASGPDAPFYHKAPTEAELDAAFEEVANDLSQLRVSM